MAKEQSSIQTELLRLKSMEELAMDYVMLKSTAANYNSRGRMSWSTTEQVRLIKEELFSRFGSLDASIAIQKAKETLQMVGF